MFEFHTADRGTIGGKVDRALSAEALANLYRNWLDKAVVARVNVRKVLKAGKPVRESYTLRSIEGGV